MDGTIAFIIVSVEHTVKFTICLMFLFCSQEENTMYDVSSLQTPILHLSCKQSEIFLLEKY